MEKLRASLARHQFASLVRQSKVTQASPKEDVASKATRLYLAKQLLEYRVLSNQLSFESEYSA